MLRSAFYPSYISVVNLLQSLHFGGALNHKRRYVPVYSLYRSVLIEVGRRYFWIVVRVYDA